MKASECKTPSRVVCHQQADCASPQACAKPNPLPALSGGPLGPEEWEVDYLVCDSQATIGLTWSIFDLGDTGMTSSLRCGDVGAGSVVIKATDKLTGTTYTETFTCAYFARTSKRLPAGTYDVAAMLYGDPAIYGNSTTLLDQVTSPNLVLAQGSNDLGEVNFLVNSFVLSWTISRGGVAARCSDVGASTVELDVLFPGSSNATTYYFGCNDNTSTTMAISYGAYTVTWQAHLVDAQGKDVAQGPSSQTFGVSSAARADLGAVHFAIQ